MELKPKNEKLREIGDGAWKAAGGLMLNPIDALKFGLYAWDAVLAEVLPIVLAPLSSEEYVEWTKNSPVKGAIHVFNDILANRLSSFTSPKDAAVEAVMDEMEKIYADRPFEENAKRIVAAVRTADRKVHP